MDQTSATILAGSLSASALIAAPFINHYLAKRKEARGAFHYHDVFPLEEVRKAMGEASKEIIVLQTWISTLGDCCLAFEQAIKRNANPTQPELQKLKIRMILMRPDHELNIARGKHSGSLDVVKKADAALSHFKGWGQKHGRDVFELRLSEELPTFALFGADDRFFFVPYLRQRDTLHSPCLELNSSKSGLAAELKLHFDGLWKTLSPMT